MTNNVQVVGPGRTLASARTKSLARQTFSFPVFLAFLLIAGVFTVNRRHSPEDPDSWWHAAVGKQILTQRAWPTVDTYSFTAPGRPWIAYEWLGEIVIGGAERLGGLRGRTALLLMLSSTLYLLLYYYSYLGSGNSKAAFVACALVLPAAGPFFTLRPQLLGYGLFLLTLICLERYRRGQRKLLWVLPAIFLVWVNTHGSFLFGLVAVGWYWGSGLFAFRQGSLVAERSTASQRLQLAFVSLLSVLSLLVTPYGSRLAAYPLEMALFQSVNIGNIQEWQPIGSELVLGAVFLGLFALLFLGQVLSNRSYRLEDLGLLLAAAFATCLHRRFLVLFVFICAPRLAAVLADWVPTYAPEKDRPVLNFALIGCLLAGMFVFFPSEASLEQVVAQTYPRAAVEYIRQHPAIGPMLNEYGWGGYLIWSLSSQRKVFIDGRADIYDYSGVLTDYLAATQLKPRGLDVLAKYNVQACLLDRDAPLAVVLRALPGWRQLYSDNLSVLFVREARSGAKALR